LATDLAVYMMEMAGTPVGVRIEGVGRVGTIENFIRKISMFMNKLSRGN